MGRMTFSTRTVLILVLGLSCLMTPAQAAGGKYALHDAVLANNPGEVQKELANGADVNAKDQAGYTPIFYAVQKGYYDVTSLLIDRGANVNATDTVGNTPLHFAVGLRNIEICRALVNAGANPRAQNVTGSTPFAVAQAGGNPEIIQMLGGQAGPPGRPGMPDMGRPMMPPGPRPVQLSDLYDTSEANADPNFPDPIKDPNEVLAKVKAYQGLREELDVVDKRSRYEIRYWLEDTGDGNVDLAKAVHRQVRGEFGFLREIAVKEDANNTVAVIDDVLRNRSTRYARMIRALQDQQEQNNRNNVSADARGRSRSIGTSTRGRTRETSRSTRPTRTTRYGARDSGVSAPVAETTPADQGPDPDIFKLEFKPVGGRDRQAVALAAKAEDEMWEWLDTNSSSKGQLSATLGNQFEREIVFIRMVAVEEGAKKTVAAIDGLILARRARFLALRQKMSEQAANAVQTGDTQGMRRGGTTSPTQRTRRGSGGWGFSGSSVSGGQNGTESTRRRP